MKDRDDTERSPEGRGDGTPPFFRPEFEEAFRFIVGAYAVRPSELAVFLPCSVQKPYSTSPSHRKFDEVIAAAVPAGKAHEVGFRHRGWCHGNLRSSPHCHVAGNNNPEKGLIGN